MHAPHVTHTLLLPRCLALRLLVASAFHPPKLTAWHPDGHLLATGNQDITTAVWDIRALRAPLARLPGRMGAIRSLRFSPDGRYLAAAEPADFVHIYDAHADFAVCQDVDLFGEIAGFSFTPQADALFVGVSDVSYSSLVQFERHHDCWDE